MKNLGGLSELFVWQLRSFHQFQKRIAKLVKNGDLVRDDAAYRLPGKLILTIDGKSSPNGS